MNKNVHLPKREQQVMDLMFRLGQASVAEVHAELDDATSHAATRMLLQRLHKRGLLQAKRQGNRYLYSPSQAPASAARRALQKLIHTFFGDSPAAAVRTLLVEENLKEEDLAELERLIQDHRRRRHAESDGRNG